MKKTFVKSVVAVALLVSFALILASCGEAQAKTFSKSGMSLTLTDDFSEVTAENYTATYESRNMAVFVLREAFSEFTDGSEMTLDEYGKLVLEANGLDLEIGREGVLTCFNYEKESNGKDYGYFVFLFRGNDAFWILQFATLADKFDGMRDEMINYASSFEV